MRIILDEIDGALYGDLIISPFDLTKLKRHETLEVCALYKRKKIYLGLILNGDWDEEEDEKPTED